MIEIKVPATTTNFGSGFDSLGMALNLYNIFHIQENDCLEIIVDEKYKGSIPQDKNNLVYKAALKVFEIVGYNPVGLRISQQTGIPISRGLGSSASCIVAGVLAANKISGARLSLQQLIDIAVDIEGHPDNVLPAIVGGFTTAMMEGETTRYLKSQIDSKFQFFFLVPLFDLSTKKARGVLPDDYSRQDTVVSISRALFMAGSLMKGNTDGLGFASDDIIHQCYRSILIKDYSFVVGTAYECGADCVYLSGAGPTIAAIVSENYDAFVNKCVSKLPQGWEILKTSPDYNGAVLESI